MRAWNVLQRAATPRRVLWAFLVAMAFGFWFFSVGPYADMQPHGGILDERFGDSAADHVRNIDAMGDAGRAAYRTFLAWDLVYALSQAVWMTGFLAIATRRWHRLPDVFMAAPALAFASDWGENVLFGVLLGQHPDPTHAVAVIAVAFQWSKLVWNVVAGLAALAFLGWLIMNPVRPAPLVRHDR